MFTSKADEVGGLARLHSHSRFGVALWKTYAGSIGVNGRGTRLPGGAVSLATTQLAPLVPSASYGRGIGADGSIQADLIATIF